MFIVPTIPPTLRSPLTIPRFTLPETTPSVSFALAADEISSIYSSSPVTTESVSPTVFWMLLICLLIFCTSFVTDWIPSSTVFVSLSISPFVSFSFIWLEISSIKSSAVLLESEIVPRMLDRLLLIFCHSFVTASACSLFKMWLFPWILSILSRELWILFMYCCASGLDFPMESEREPRDSDKVFEELSYCSDRLST